jgi:hypothetical protein
MIRIRHAVCSERGGKPVTRGICATRRDAEELVARLRQRDAPELEDDYWIAEIGPESAAWSENFS